jgi:hypothetical protein
VDRWNVHHPTRAWIRSMTNSPSIFFGACQVDHSWPISET